jgi:hypothetical protein
MPLGSFAGWGAAIADAGPKAKAKKLIAAKVCLKVASIVFSLAPKK